MNPQEKVQLEQFLQQLNSTQAGAKDSDANALIAESVKQQPDANFRTQLRLLSDATHWFPALLKAGSLHPESRLLFLHRNGGAHPYASLPKAGRAGFSEGNHPARRQNSG